MRPRSSTRLVTADDVDFLWEMLYWAAHADEDGVGIDDVRHNPDLVGYAAAGAARAISASSPRSKVDESAPHGSDCSTRTRPTTGCTSTT